MGSKYNISEEDLQKWRTAISDLAFTCMCVKDNYMFMLLITWIYEYIEVTAVNGTGEHAGLVPVKRNYPLYAEPLINLFRLRNQFVHSPYDIDDRRLGQLEKDVNSINNVLTSLGFSRPVLNFNIPRNILCK